MRQNIFWLSVNITDLFFSSKLYGFFFPLRAFQKNLAFQRIITKFRERKNNRFRPKISQYFYVQAISTCIYHM